jgi:hypothetical protein
MKCCFCGPVKNCAPFLETVLKNIELLGTLFEEYRIVIFYDHSVDNTLQKLHKYQNKNPRLKIYVNSNFSSQFRTHRIAYARNYCLAYIRQSLPDYQFAAMMDFDDPNCKKCNPLILKKYLNREDWDALSFNTKPAYYDIWGLSIYPFCFSYNHFRNNQQFYKIMQTYVTKKLEQLDNGALLPCISSFNGFAIYRIEKFSGCYYDGSVRMDLLIPSDLTKGTNGLKAHMIATRSPIIYKDYGHVKGRYEDCEHRAFHLQAINKHGAKIMISPEVIFG